MLETSFVDICKCVVCLKNFTRPTNLRRHLRSHERETRRLSCCVCLATFGRRDNYVRHFLRSHENPFLEPRPFNPRNVALKPGSRKIPEATLRKDQKKHTKPIFRIVPGKSLAEKSSIIAATKTKENSEGPTFDDLLQAIVILQNRIKTDIRIIEAKRVNKQIRKRAVAKPDRNVHQQFKRRGTFTRSKLTDTSDEEESPIGLTTAVPNNKDSAQIYQHNNVITPGSSILKTDLYLSSDTDV